MKRLIWTTALVMVLVGTAWAGQEGKDTPRGGYNIEGKEATAQEFKDYLAKQPHNGKPEKPVCTWNGQEVSEQEFARLSSEGHSAEATAVLDEAKQVLAEHKAVMEQNRKEERKKLIKAGLIWDLTDEEKKEAENENH